MEDNREPRPFAHALDKLTGWGDRYQHSREREWGCYATVPGIATHQLVRRDGVDAVRATTWEWDGVAPRQVDRDASGLVRPERPPDDEGGLW